MARRARNEKGRQEKEWVEVDNISSISERARRKGVKLKDGDAVSSGGYQHLEARGDIRREIIVDEGMCTLCICRI